MFIGILVIGILVVTGVLVYVSQVGSSPSAESPQPQLSPSPSPSPQAGALPHPFVSEIRITPPNGWYAHTTSEHSVMYTKQQVLPSVGATEGFAYGEHINVSGMKRQESMEAWEALYAPDDVLIISKAWSTRNGHKLLKVEQEAGGAAGTMVTYHLFMDDRVYSFGLWSSGDYDRDTKTWTRRNQAGIDALEQIMESYLPHLQ